ncbi:MAG: hypothetical protein ACFB9N_05115 [Geitlerinemataceae cyanobacterium]
MLNLAIFDNRRSPVRDNPIPRVQYPRYCRTPRRKAAYLARQAINRDKRRHLFPLEVRSTDANYASD